MISFWVGKISHLVRVFLHVLDGLQNAQSLLHIAAKGQVVDCGVLDDTLHTAAHPVRAMR